MEQFLNDILFTKLLFFSFFLLTNPSIATKPAYIFPIFFLYYSIFYSHVRSNTSRTRIKDLWESLHAVDILAAIYDYHGRSWGGQLGPDPAGFKRRCRIGPWHRVSAKVSRYISISRRTIPTLSARRKTALSPRHSFCKHVCIRVYPGRDAYIRRGVASTRLHNAWCWYWTRATRNCEMRTTEN